MFKEKVGEIFVGLGFKVDKATKAKAEATVSNLSKTMAGKFRKSFAGVGAMLFSKVGALASVAGVVGAISNVNSNLKETVDLFDDLQTQADSIGLTFKQMQMLRAVSIFGDIPDVNKISKSIIKFQQYMGELKNGVDDEQTMYLKQMGLTGNEDTMKAFQIMLNSLYKSSKSGNSATVEQFFKSGALGRIDESMKQFFIGGGLAAFKYAEEFYKKNPKYMLSESMSKELGNTDNKIKEQQIATESQKALDLKAKDSLKIFQEEEEFKRQLNRLTQDLIPLLSSIISILDVVVKPLSAIAKFFSLGKDPLGRKKQREKVPPFATWKDIWNVSKNDFNSIGKSNILSKKE